MAKTTSFQVYQDKKGEFRFTLLAKNGEAVAQASEGYTTKAACMGAVKRMKDWCNTEVISFIDKNAKKAVAKVATKAPVKKAVAKKVLKAEAEVKA